MLIFTVQNGLDAAKPTLPRVSPWPLVLRPWGPENHQNLVPFWEPSFLLLGAEKSSLEPLLGGPRRISRQVSAILGAKRLPKQSPGVKLGPKSNPD